MIYIMCDRTECMHNKVHNNKFNRCYSDDITIKDSEECNGFYSLNVLKDIEIYSEPKDDNECECLYYEKYYHNGQKYGRCYECGEEFEIY